MFCFVLITVSLLLLVFVRTELEVVSKTVRYLSVMSKRLPSNTGISRMHYTGMLDNGVLIEKLIAVKLVNKPHAFYGMGCRGWRRIVI
jgi:NO-binding membrane sensor protein with MHYT domain